MEKLLEELEIKNFDHPDEVLKLDRCLLELMWVAGGACIGRVTLEPGWRWSESVKPISKTDLCQTSHFQYIISGNLGIRMEDGIQKECRAGDIVILPPGHDAWVVGNKPVVMIDFRSMGHYVKRK
jgi:hypothetical protein